MKRNEPVTHVMTKDPITVHHGDHISTARQLMRDHGVHHLPVVSGRDLIGMISSSDILRVSFGDAFNTDERAVDATLDHTMTIEQLMHANPATVSLHGSVRDAAQVLAEGDFHAVAVVDGKELAGIVTSTDLIHYLLSL
ncbi:MAG: CBS domain-containing protein [Akkermansiaceae bacterium]|nr:CBS domain-containing protein [Akkermansiaceae bacterium]MCP5551810.1 CBS domain-containing protein [Akkermansiaceae bacterium]